MKKAVGKVYLVGAGPGDPGLITRRGMECIESAHSIVMDDLVSSDLVAQSKAKFFYVGKRGPGAARGASLKSSQHNINRLLVGLAKKGQFVVRLKGGDPVVFGRASEELEALKRAKIPYEIVPGVTSAIAVPAYAGIPISDRRWSSQVTFLTGQEGKERISKTPAVDWAKLYPGQTLVILMGVGRWPQIRKNLLKFGWPKKKPVAAIEYGTTPKQRILLTNLGESRVKFKKNKLVAPAIVVVGDVAKLSRSLAWFKKERPLLGRKIVVTRSEFQSSNFTRLLREKGAEILSCPSILIKPLVHTPELQNIYRSFKSNACKYDWILFLSSNGVRSFIEGLDFYNGKFGNVKIGVVGPKTKEAVEEHGGKVRFQSKDFNAKSLLSALKKVKGMKILVPRVQNGPGMPLDLLRKKGAFVKEIGTYRNERAPKPDRKFRRRILNESDALTFTSTSTARNFLSFFMPKEAKFICRNILACSIGPITTSALKKMGFKKILEAPGATIESMADTLIKNLSKKNKKGFGIE